MEKEITITIEKECHCSSSEDYVYKIHSKVPLTNQEYQIILQKNKKPSHQLRKLYFKLIDFLFSQEKRFDLLHTDYLEEFKQMTCFLSKFPTYDTFRTYALNIYRKLLELTLSHKHGVSDEKIENQEFSELYNNLLIHCLDCNIDLQGFYATYE